MRLFHLMSSYQELKNPVSHIVQVWKLFRFTTVVMPNLQVQEHIRQTDLERYLLLQKNDAGIQPCTTQTRNNQFHLLPDSIFQEQKGRTFIRYKSGKRTEYYSMTGDSSNLICGYPYLNGNRGLHTTTEETMPEMYWFASCRSRYR